MKRKWVSSFFLALKAIDALKTCHRMDLNNRDVFFGLGVFDYYTDKLSGVLKFLFYLFHKENKEEGLRKLHIAADEAVYSAVEAKSMLLHVYLFLEHRNRKALTLAEELAGRFRNDPRNKFLQGVAHLKLGMDREYRKVIGYFHKRGQEAASPEQTSSWNNWALYLEASYDLFHSQISRARSKLETILSVADAEEGPFMIAWPLVKIGMSYDLEGDRDKALEYYNQVLEMENGAGAQFLALKYRDRPAKKRDPFLCY
jgi:tetratricopeptide (TPR) repeat protein